jgi:hypothetical protein
MFGCVEAYGAWTWLILFVTFTVVASPSTIYGLPLDSSFSLVPTYTSLTNVVFCAALTANPSLVAVDGTLFVDQVDSGRSSHLYPRIPTNDVRTHKVTVHEVLELTFL